MPIQSPTETRTANELEQALNSQFERFSVADGSTRYRCRVECLPDAIHLKMALTPIATEWHDSPAFWDEDGSLVDKRNFMPDMDLWFALKNDVSIGEVRWLIDQFTDLHVAVESLKLAHEYDGERDWDVYDRPDFQPPKRAVLQRVTKHAKLVSEVLLRMSEEHLRLATTARALTGRSPRHQVKGTR